MGQVETENSESVFTNGASHQSSEARGRDTPDSASGPDRHSISAQYFGDVRSILNMEGNQSASAGDTSERSSEHIRPESRLGNAESSPERGRTRRASHIPVAARLSINQNFSSPPTYRSSHGAWVPTTHLNLPLMPMSSPPPPPCAARSIPYYPSTSMTHENLEVSVFFLNLSIQFLTPALSSRRSLRDTRAP